VILYGNKDIYKELTLSFTDLPAEAAAQAGKHRGPRRKLRI